MKQLKKNLKEILFIDIETAASTATYDELDSSTKAFWSHKARLISRNQELTEDEIAEIYTARAAIYSEFSRVVCISVGILIIENKSVIGMRTKSFVDKDEVVLLTDFCDMLDNHFDKPKKQYLCGHNIKEFDIPFICRRLLINGLPIPKKLDISGKKPWEVDHLVDTLTLWKFGDYKHYTSLALLAHVLGIPTPKDDIDGSMVHDIFWNEQDLHRIARYCEKDVVTSAKVLAKLLRVDIDKDLLVESKTDID